MTGATLSQRLNDRDSDLVQDALTRDCVLCEAPANQDCVSPIDGKPMTDRIVHLVRTAK